MQHTSQKFQDLIVWQKAHQFVLLVYEITKYYPKEETYGLTSQFRRAAVSIAANIAEGFAKRTITDKARFFNIAEGSLEECKYYIILSTDLNYIQNNNDLWKLCNETGKLLFSYKKSMLMKRSK